MFDTDLFVLDSLRERLVMSGFDIFYYNENGYKASKGNLSLIITKNKDIQSYFVAIINGNVDYGRLDLSDKIDLMQFIFKNRTKINDIQMISCSNNDHVLNNIEELMEIINE